VSFKDLVPNPFKSFGFWAEHDLFLSWVEEGWSCIVDGIPIFRVCKKLKAVKKNFES